MFDELLDHAEKELFRKAQRKMGIRHWDDLGRDLTEWRQATRKLAKRMAEIADEQEGQ
jgi:hypothetical protein